MSNLSLEHEELFTSVVSLVRDYLVQGKDKVIEFKTPDQLKKIFPFQLEDEGTDDDTLLKLCQTVVKYSVDTRHPHFYNQLFTGIDEVGLLASFLTAATNTSMYTFEMAPVFSLMETEVLSKMRELVGWEGGEGDGIFSPGGSLSNLYGLVLARYRKFPESKTKGIHSLPQMAIFCSEDSHYSILKSSFIMGIGIENVIKVKSDENGKMVSEDLDRALTESKNEGKCPLAVVAMAATTILGAFDPLSEIASICEKHSVWMHVDGCLGSSVLMSQTHRSLAAGIERADSVSWNPHKSLGVPFQCSAFLTRHKGLMKESNCTKATYLFQQDKLSYCVDYDSGDKSFQCGRLNDVFKLWLMWKQKGTSGFEKVIDRSLQMAGYLTERIRQREGFQLVIENPEYTNVCFWYFPPKMRDLYPLRSPIAPSSAAKMSKVAPIIKARMIEKGSAMFSYQPRKELPNFFRMTLTTPTTEGDMDWLLKEIESLGSDIFITLSNGLV